MLCCKKYKRDVMKYILLTLLVVRVSFVTHAEDIKISISEITDRWSKEEASAWYARQPWLVGFNYVPSYACNTTEWWQKETFDSRTIDRELAWAADIGYNTTRVFIQYIVWKDNPEGFKKRFDQFLDIAEKHGISVMPVLFDDCSFGSPCQSDPFLGKQREPIPGMILPSWTPSPGRKLGNDPNEKPILKKYVKDMVSSFRSDKRIVIWDLFNEPMHRAMVGNPALLEEVFSWAREAFPTQPLTISVWNENSEINNVMIANSDVISFHAYIDFNGLKNKIRELRKHGRPVICTEWMARIKGSNFATDLPLFKNKNVGCFQWGFVNGRTQCQYPWSNKPGGKVDARTGWFHDILHKDGTPYRKDEIDVIKKIISEKQDLNTAQ
jgi:hypothetical protein